MSKVASRYMEVNLAKTVFRVSRELKFKRLSTDK